MLKVNHEKSNTKTKSDAVSVCEFYTLLNVETINNFKVSLNSCSRLSPVKFAHLVLSISQHICIPLER